MAQEDEKKPAADGVTAEGIVEAIEQDLELTVEQIKDAVEKKLGVGKASKPEPSKTDPKED